MLVSVSPSYRELYVFRGITLVLTENCKSLAAILSGMKEVFCIFLMIFIVLFLQHLRPHTSMKGKQYVFQNFKKISTQFGKMYSRRP